MAHLTSSRPMIWISFGLSALVVAFLLLDAAVSLFAPHLLADAQAQVGFPSDLSPIVGSIILLCALLQGPLPSVPFSLQDLQVAPSARISGWERSGRRLSSSRWP